MKGIIWVPSAVVGTKRVLLHGQSGQDGIKPHQAVMEQREEEGPSSRGNSVSKGTEARAVAAGFSSLWQRGAAGAGCQESSGSYMKDSNYCREVFWASGCRWQG